jgi:hypothetical protein
VHIIQKQGLAAETLIGELEHVLTTVETGPEERA